MHHEWQIPLVEKLSSIVRLVDALHPLITNFCAESVRVQSACHELIDACHMISGLLLRQQFSTLLSRPLTRYAMA